MGLELEAVSYLICGAFVVTMNGAGEVLAPGAVAVREEEIVAVGPPAELKARYVPGQVLDYPHGLILPGLINAHTHAAMALFRGLADDLPLEEWLNGYIFPAERKIDGDFVYWGTKLAVAEMLLSGTTTFCDMYLFADAVARAAVETGIRAVIGEVLYDFPSPNYGPPADGLRFSEELCLAWQGHPRVRVAIQPHAVYTCSPDLLQKCGDLAARYQVPLIIHLSETRKEVADCLARYGATPVGHLHNLGLLRGNLVADHAVALTPEDMELLAAHGVGVAHCPESNMKLASGIAPVAALLKQGVAVGLGTDGCASNNNLDLLQELDTAAKLQKVHNLDPTSLSAPAALALATRGSARVLGLGREVGALTPGRKADLAVVDLDQPHLTPVYNPYSQLVYAATGADVQTVMVHGRVLVQDRELLAFDLEETLARARELAQRVTGKPSPAGGCA
ncbi:MAG: S-adenosylhomocysteine deaminase [Deltaproteobacteria bacterium RBG_13_58_19]|nr:MAG: S-adenosylhomocysteine deaminase [Deltaproteobacteria bacterium RBG_13_58_19]